MEGRGEEGRRGEARGGERREGEGRQGEGSGGLSAILAMCITGGVRSLLQQWWHTSLSWSSWYTAPPPSLNSATC